MRIRIQLVWPEISESTGQTSSQATLMPLVLRPHRAARIERIPLFVTSEWPSFSQSPQKRSLAPTEAPPTYRRFGT